MSRIVKLPPDVPLCDDGAKTGGWWRELSERGRVVCELCPRECHLKPGDRGFCFVRENRDGQVVLSTYGRSTGFCVDPIEKKPLNNFYPGTSVLSFGTAGCNLGCKFCQNWTISKSRETDRLSDLATPEAIASAASRLGCQSVAFTYNDPVVWAEYAIDTAAACRAVGVKTVAVTAGYITPAARGPFFTAMDAANVDLKAFTEDFYQSLALSHLEPVLGTLRWLKHETDVWFEITNLIIPRVNDSADELQAMCGWILENLGDDVPLHFSAFHPDFRMTDRSATPPETLLAAYDIANRAGLKYVYVGNINDSRHQSTYCPKCDGCVIQRNSHQLGHYKIADGCCGGCGAKIAGHFENKPGSWGRKRMPVNIAQFSQTVPVAEAPDSPKSPPTAAMIASRGPTTTEPPEISEQQEPLIIEAASRSIVHLATTGIAGSTADTLAEIGRQSLDGVVVVLRREDRIRGNNGLLGDALPLPVLLDAALRSVAGQSNHQPAISATELPYLHIDVWLLFAAETVSVQGDKRADGIVLGRHGVQISQGQATAILTPDVAVRLELDAVELLQRAARQAGLPSGAWREPSSRLVTFEARLISASLDQRAIPQSGDPTRPLYSSEQFKQVIEFCRSNIATIFSGGTPVANQPGVADQNVSGLSLAIKLPGRLGDFPRANQFALRPMIPLQTTLYGLAGVAAKMIHSLDTYTTTAGVGGMKLDLTILHDPAMHGTLAHPDLRGLDPSYRTAFVKNGDHQAWMFDPRLTAEELVNLASRHAQISETPQAVIYSFATQSTEESVVVSEHP